jgi:hypothetical protein
MSKMSDAEHTVFGGAEIFTMLFLFGLFSSNAVSGAALWAISIPFWLAMYNAIQREMARRDVERALDNIEALGCRMKLPDDIKRAMNNLLIVGRQYARER